MQKDAELVEVQAFIDEVTQSRRPLLLISAAPAEDTLDVRLRRGSRRLLSLSRERDPLLSLSLLSEPESESDPESESEPELESESESELEDEDEDFEPLCTTLDVRDGPFDEECDVNAAYRLARLEERLLVSFSRSFSFASRILLAVPDLYNVSHQSDTGSAILSYGQK